MHTFSSPEDVRASIGTEMGPTVWQGVAQERVNEFALATGDHQWIHVDPVRAVDGPYGGTIAHGYLTLALIPAMSALLYAFDFGRVRINYGLDKVRFPAPVRVDSRVRLRSTVAAITPQGSGHLVSVDHVLEVQDAVKPGCVARALTLVLPQEGTVARGLRPRHARPGRDGRP